MVNGIREENLGFTACVRHNRKTIHLGTHDTHELAVKAQKDYRKKNGLSDQPVRGRPRKNVMHA